MPERGLTGLTSAEVVDRTQRGEVNRPPRSDLAEYVQIVRRNLFTLFNAMVVPAAIALFVLDEWQGAIAVSSMAIVNSAIALVQEVRAKWHLDKLALLVEARARVVRDGDVSEIPAGEVVRGDTVLLTTGSAVVADGPVLEARFLEVDEALLTGESDPVRRAEGDKLLSGSFCVAGEGAYRAEQVGAAAFAHATTAQAKRYHYAASPLTRVINRIIEVLSATAVGLCLLYVLLYHVRGLNVDELVKMVAATITSMVPQGLVLTATISFTLGAVRMSSRGAVVQRLHAVETMAAVDVVCTDKTGTLTTNRLRLDRIQVLTDTVSEAEIRDRLRLFASVSLDRENKNLAALRTALGEATTELVDQIPFKSQNRYSAVRVRTSGTECALVLGACEALRNHLTLGTAPTLEATWKGLLPTGLRLLLFADTDHQGPFGPTLEGITVRPLALVALSDELRPEAAAVLSALAAQGIAFKVVSGDNPETVRATVGGLDLPMSHEDVVSGDELAASSNPGELIATRSVFGRVAPEQKVAIVKALQAQGRHVAMIGDGVNDVLPIKAADLGIAMGEGSQASKTVAALVLERNDFGLLPETLEEGRTIVRNLRRSAKLFLTKNVYSFVLILMYALGVFGLPFPYIPQQVTLLNWLVIGIPALVIALSRERSTGATRPRFLREVGWFAIRTGLIFAASAVVVLLLSAEHGEKGQRTMLLTVLVLLGITALLRTLTDGEEKPLAGDGRFRLLAGAVVPVYLLAMYWPPSTRFFELEPLTFAQWGIALLVAGVGYFLTLLSDRMKMSQKPRNFALVLT
jgi:cation-transporting ATPase E